MSGLIACVSYTRNALKSLVRKLERKRIYGLPSDNIKMDVRWKSYVVVDSNKVSVGSSGRFMWKRITFCISNMQGNFFLQSQQPSAFLEELWFMEFI
jgi:hypothetical protein